LKKIAEKLDPERDADKKRLLEITDRQFEVIIILMFLCGGVSKPGRKVKLKYFTII